MRKSRKSREENVKSIFKIAPQHLALVKKNHSYWWMMCGRRGQHLMLVSKHLKKQVLKMFMF